MSRHQKRRFGLKTCLLAFGQCENRVKGHANGRFRQGNDVCDAHEKHVFCTQNRRSDGFLFPGGLHPNLGYAERCSAGFHSNKLKTPMKRADRAMSANATRHKGQNMGMYTDTEYCVMCDCKLSPISDSQWCSQCEIFNAGYDFVERNLQDLPIHMTDDPTFAEVWLAGAYSAADRIREGDEDADVTDSEQLVLSGALASAKSRLPGNHRLNKHGYTLLANGVTVALRQYIGEDPRIRAREIEAELARVEARKQREHDDFVRAVEREAKAREAARTEQPEDIREIQSEAQEKPRQRRQSMSYWIALVAFALMTTAMLVLWGSMLVTHHWQWRVFFLMLAPLSQAASAVMRFRNRY